MQDDTNKPADPMAPTAPMGDEPAAPTTPAEPMGTPMPEPTEPETPTAPMGGMEEPKAPDAQAA